MHNSKLIESNKNTNLLPFLIGTGLATGLGLCLFFNRDLANRTSEVFFSFFLPHQTPGSAVPTTSASASTPGSAVRVAAASASLESAAPTTSASASTPESAAPTTSASASPESAKQAAAASALFYPKQSINITTIKKAIEIDAFKTSDAITNALCSEYNLVKTKDSNAEKIPAIYASYLIFLIFEESKKTVDNYLETITIPGTGERLSNYSYNSEKKQQTQDNILLSRNTDKIATDIVDEDILNTLVEDMYQRNPLFKRFLVAIDKLNKNFRENSNTSELPLCKLMIKACLASKLSAASSLTLLMSNPMEDILTTERSKLLQVFPMLTQTEDKKNLDGRFYLELLNEDNHKSTFGTLNPGDVICELDKILPK